MASAFSHALVGFAIGRSHRWTVNPQRFWLLTFACSILPDLDVLTFPIGIPYEHILGHRGFTHSLFFAALLGLGVVRFCFPQVLLWSRQGWKLVTHFFLVTASHGCLDAFTDGGLGVAFFAPFENTRYFFPWTPIIVSPIGISNFFSERGLDVLKSEFLWIGIPVAVWLAGIWMVVSFSHKTQTNKPVGRVR